MPDISLDDKQKRVLLDMLKQNREDVLKLYSADEKAQFERMLEQIDMKSMPQETLESLKRKLDEVIALSPEAKEQPLKVLCDVIDPILNPPSQKKSARERLIAHLPGGAKKEKHADIAGALVEIIERNNETISELINQYYEVSDISACRNLVADELKQLKGAKAHLSFGNDLYSILQQAMQHIEDVDDSMARDIAVLHQSMVEHHEQYKQTYLTVPPSADHKSLMRRIHEIKPGKIKSLSGDYPAAEVAEDAVIKPRRKKKTRVVKALSIAEQASELSGRIQSKQDKNAYAEETQRILLSLKGISDASGDKSFERRQLNAELIQAATAHVEKLTHYHAVITPQVERAKALMRRQAEHDFTLVKSEYTDAVFADLDKLSQGEWQEEHGNRMVLFKAETELERLMTEDAQRIALLEAMPKTRTKILDLSKQLHGEVPEAIEKLSVEAMQLHATEGVHISTLREMMDTLDSQVETLEERVRDQRAMQSQLAQLKAKTGQLKGAQQRLSELTTDDPIVARTLERLSDVLGKLASLPELAAKTGLWDIESSARHLLALNIDDIVEEAERHNVLSDQRNDLRARSDDLLKQILAVAPSLSEHHIVENLKRCLSDNEPMEAHQLQNTLDLDGRYYKEAENLFERINKFAAYSAQIDGQIEWAKAAKESIKGLEREDTNELLDTLEAIIQSKPKPDGYSERSIKTIEKAISHNNGLLKDIPEQFDRLKKESRSQRSRFVDQLNMKENQTFQPNALIQADRNKLISAIEIKHPNYRLNKQTNEFEWKPSLLRRLLSRQPKAKPGLIETMEAFLRDEPMPLDKLSDMSEQAKALSNQLQDKVKLPWWDIFQKRKVRQFLSKTPKLTIARNITVKKDDNEALIEEVRTLRQQIKSADALSQLRLQAIDSQLTQAPPLPPISLSQSLFSKASAKKDNTPGQKPVPPKKD